MILRIYILSLSDFFIRLSALGGVYAPPPFFFRYFAHLRRQHRRRLQSRTSVRSCSLLLVSLHLQQTIEKRDIDCMQDSLKKAFLPTVNAVFFVP